MLDSIRKHKGLTAVAVLAAGLSLFLGVQYFCNGSDSSGLVQEKLKSMNLSGLWYTMLYVHIVGAITALGLGCLQFIGRFRRGKAIVHRLIGGLYALGVTVGGIGGLYLSFYATGGWTASLGFLALALLWLYTLIRGVRAVLGKERDLRAHRAWMTRNYALSLAAVTLRIYLPVAVAILGDGHFNDAYRAIAWLCWLPNLLAAQLLVHRAAKRRKTGSPPIHSSS